MGTRTVIGGIERVVEGEVEVGLDFLFLRKDLIKVYLCWVLLTSKNLASFLSLLGHLTDFF